MNHRQFVIDGTSLIVSLTKEHQFAPLLQLLQLLHEQQKPFFCYFDADTRYKFERDEDKQLYQNLVKFGLSDYFNQVAGGGADKLILKQATDIQATVISAKDFKEYEDRYDWLRTEREHRLLTPRIEGGNLCLDALFIKTPAAQDTISVLRQLVNGLERKRDNLHGSIDRYKSDRSFGFIQRANGDKKLFFHQKDVQDKDLDLSREDILVDFQIDVDKSGGIYYFCAVGVQERAAIKVEEMVEQLEAEKEKLAASKNFLHKQTMELKASFEREMQTILQQNKTLDAENTTLKDQLSLQTNSESKLAQQIKAERQKHADELKAKDNLIDKKEAIINDLKKQIEQLNAQKQAALEALDRKAEENNSQAMTIDFQQEKISTLDEDLKAALRLVQMQRLDESEALMYDQLKKDYDLLLNAMGQKNSQISFLSNNLHELQTQVEQMSSPLSQGAEIERLTEKLNDLELSNQTLKKQLDQLGTLGEKAKKSKISTPRDEEIEAIEEAQHKNEGNTVVKLSDDAKQQRSDRNRKVIVEATRTELENWWHGLEDQWKVAFNQAILTRGEVNTTPDEEQLRSLFKRKKIDIVGSGILLFGLNQLSFKLTNLSGFKELSQIEELNISGHDFSNLRGINHLEKLEFLNCTSNKITTLEGLNGLKGLKTLIIQDNDLVSVRGIEQMTHLEYFNCLYNSQLKSIAKIKDLPNLQILCVDNYKTIIRLELEDLSADNPNLEIRNV